MGYFSHRRFVASDGGGAFTDEIALNPTYFASHGLREVFQTVAHEMVHLWQAHFGSPGRGRYHNQEWAAKMIEIGLMPTDTGKVGGKTTGQKMSDYPIANGRFSAVYESLATHAFKITWVDRYVARSSSGQTLAEAAGTSLIFTPGDREKKPTRVKYVCAASKTAVWGRPKLNLICGDTGQPFLPQGHE